MSRFFYMLALTTIVNCQLSIVNSVQAQVDYQRQYTNAKVLYKEGKYNLAMETFKSLITYDKSNPFSEYASFYYALSAYHLGYQSVAKDMFNQIKQLYPSWDKMDEVNLWLAKIHFDKQEYFQGINQLSGIKSSKLQKEANAIKKNGLVSLTDIDALKRMNQEYPKDAIIGEKLAFELSKKIESVEDQELLEKLISTFRLKRSELVEETPATIFKDVYSVSVLFPFLANTIEPTPVRKRNQFVLDLYEGMKLAVDTLAKRGIKISLRAYDTERNPKKISEILSLEELKSSDMIVGPLFQEENKPIQEFSKLYKINLFNPVSNNYDMVSDNPYGFLFQPSLEALGAQAARFLDRNQVNKKCMVFLGDTKRDSTLAMSFIKAAADTELEVIQIERFTKETSSRILQILATPTEFDEFKYPKQFTLPKDSLGCIFVASDDPLFFTKVISAVTTRGDKITIVGSENWLDITTDYEKLQMLGVVLQASNFTSPGNTAYKRFENKFIQVHGRVPSTSLYTNYAKIGYEFMLFAGNMLKKHGVYFQDTLQKGIISGYVTEGFDYRHGRDNHLIPFVQFRGGELVLIEKPVRE